MESMSYTPDFADKTNSEFAAEMADAKVNDLDNARTSEISEDTDRITYVARTESWAYKVQQEKGIEVRK